MYIVIGRGTSDGPGRPLPGEHCPRCGRRTLEAFTRYEYLHILWIPAVPIERTACARCTSCKGVFTRKFSTFDPTTVPEPWSPFHYTGLVLVVLVIIYSLVTWPRLAPVPWTSLSPPPAALSDLVVPRSADGP